LSYRPTCRPATAAHDPLANRLAAHYRLRDATRFCRETPSLSLLGDFDDTARTHGAAAFPDREAHRLLHRDRGD